MTDLEEVKQFALEAFEELRTRDFDRLEVVVITSIMQELAMYWLAHDHYPPKLRPAEEGH